MLQGNQVTVIDGPANYNSLERGTRRKLPNVPGGGGGGHLHHHQFTQSLPRQHKRHNNAPKPEAESDRHRRQLPQLPPPLPPPQQHQPDQDREPTPDYDSSVVAHPSDGPDTKQTDSVNQLNKHEQSSKKGRTNHS